MNIVIGVKFLLRKNGKLIELKENIISQTLKNGDITLLLDHNREILCLIESPNSLIPLDTEKHNSWSLFGWATPTLRLSIIRIKDVQIFDNNDMEVISPTIMFPKDLLFKRISKGKYYTNFGSIKIPIKEYETDLSKIAIVTMGN